MPGPGRNELCPCGSGRKVKPCCGQHRGPGEDNLARAYLAHQAHDAARKLRHHTNRELRELFDDLFKVPELDLALTITLPQLLTPDLQRLYDAVKADDPDAADELIPRLLDSLDTRRAGPARPRDRQPPRHQSPRLPASRCGDHRPRQPLAHPSPRQPRSHRIHPDRAPPYPRWPATRRLTAHRANTIEPVVALDKITRTMPELALYDQERDPLAGHLDSVGVPELVRRESPPHTGPGGQAA
jgi:SEC-C motif